MTMETQSNPVGFVNYVIRRLKDDTGFGAVMRRADQPQQCCNAWEYLVPFCNLAMERERLSFALIGAAIAREKPETDGVLGLGAVLRKICNGDSDAVERETMRLRRLLACDGIAELAPVMGRFLRYLQSKGMTNLCYERLLWDMLKFGEPVKIRWTQEFFKKTETSEEEMA